MKNAYLYWTWWAMVSLFWICILAISIWQHSLALPLIAIGQYGGQAIYGRLERARWLFLLVPGFVAFAIGLAGLYYVGDLALFPHSPNAAYRLHDAVTGGVLASVCGFLFAWVMFNIGRRPRTDNIAESQSRRE